MLGSSEKYVSYLLRMWRVGGDDDTVWRASLESAQTGESEAFADLESLFVFLKEKTSQTKGWSAE